MMSGWILGLIFGMALLWTAGTIDYYLNKITSRRRQDQEKLNITLDEIKQRLQEIEHKLND